MVDFLVLELPTTFNSVDCSQLLEILMPDVTVLGGGALGRCLGHEDKTLINGMGLLRNHTETPSALLFLQMNDVIVIFVFVNYLFSLVSLKILFL